MLGRQDHARTIEDGPQVQRALLVGLAFQQFQQVGATDEFGQRRHAQPGQPHAGFFGDEPEVVHHHFGQADEVLQAQHLVLSGDAGGAVVEVADAQVFAPQRDHGRGAEAEALGAQNGGLDHVQTGLQAAVGLHPHLFAQAVHAQRLVGFGQAQLPRRAGVLDRGERAGAGAAVVAGDGDQVSVGLGHTGGDGADAGARHELHRHQRARVDLLEVVDQLRQVFDGVDVVVRRRRDQRHAGFGVAQLGDLVVDLVARQLATFAGLRPLCHFDLQHLSAGQIGRGDTKAARGHLLDLGVLLGAVAGRVFAALTGVRAPAEAVHGGGQRLVRLGRQRAQAHAGRVEALEDGVDGLDVIDGQRRVQLLELEQIAHRRDRAVIDQRRVLFIIGVLTALHGLVQRADHIRVVRVVLAVEDKLHQAALIRRLARIPSRLGQMGLIVFEVAEPCALNAVDGAFKAQRHHLVVQAHGFEQLRAAIAGDGRNAHLRDDLVQTLVDALAVRLGERCIVLGGGELALLAHVVQRGIGQVGVNHAGAIADEAGELVRVARGGGFNGQIAVAAQALGYQPAVQGAGGEQGMNGQFALFNPAVRQHQNDHAALAHGRNGHITGLPNGGFQPHGRVVLQVDHFVAIDRIGQQAAELGLRQQRRIHHEPRGALGRFLEHRALGAQRAFQAHHDLLAQRVDGRIGDLGELLTEVVVGRANLAGQHGERGVVAHAADAFLAAFGQHPQHVDALFIGEREHLLVDRDVGGLQAVERVGIVVEAGFQAAQVLLQPLLVGEARGQQTVDVFGAQQGARIGVDGQHLAGPQAALLDHFFGRVVRHPHFGCEHDGAIAGDHIARGAQAIAVGGAGGVAAVGEHHAGGAVPGFHLQRVVLEERAHVGVEVFDVLPGGRNQRAHRGEQIHAAGEQHFQHIVEALRV